MTSVNTNNYNGTVLFTPPISWIYGILDNISTLSTYIIIIIIIFVYICNQKGNMFKGKRDKCDNITI